MDTGPGENSEKANFIVMELENNYVNRVKRITSHVFGYLPLLFKS